MLRDRNLEQSSSKNLGSFCKNKKKIDKENILTVGIEEDLEKGSHFTVIVATTATLSQDPSK